MFHDLNKQERSNASKYFHFNRWCLENGWEPYVDDEVWINESKVVRHVDLLWKEYFSELPQSIKEVI